MIFNLPFISLWVIRWIRVRYIYSAFLWLFVVLELSLEITDAPTSGFDILARWMHVSPYVLIMVGAIASGVIALDRNITRQIGYTLFTLMYVVALGYGTFSGEINPLERIVMLAMLMVSVMVVINTCFMTGLRATIDEVIELRMKVAQLEINNTELEIEYRTEHGR